MPTREEHRIQARRNRDILTDPGFDFDKWPDWATTIAFYTALHTISQVLVEEGKSFATHEDRRKYLREAHSEIHKTYKQLQDASEVARYSPFNSFRAFHPVQHVRGTVIGLWLVKVEQYTAEWLAENV